MPQLQVYIFLPGTAPRCRRMDPVLLGRTVRFHPCLCKLNNIDNCKQILNANSKYSASDSESRGKK